MSRSVAASDINSAVSPTGKCGIAPTRAIYSSQTPASEMSLMRSFRFSISSRRTSNGPSYTLVFICNFISLGIFFHERQKEAHRRAGSAFGQVFVGSGGHFGRYVEVYPRATKLSGKDLQKLAAADYARVAAVAGCGDIWHVRKTAFYDVVVLLPHRHRPHIVAAFFGQIHKVHNHGAIVGHERVGVLAEGRERRAGKRCRIGDYCRVVALGVGYSVCQNNAALCISVEYLYRFARQRF